MPNRPLVTLGPYTFQLATATYQTLVRQTRQRWARLETIGTHPQLQHVGKGEERIELDGVIYPHFRGGLRQVDELRTMQEAGVPYQFITGRGDVLGYWVVETVEEQQALPQSDGAPLRQRFRIGLHYYGPTPPPR